MVPTVSYLNGKDSAGCSRELPHGGEKLTWVSCAVLQLSLCRVRVPSCAALSGDGGTSERLGQLAKCFKPLLETKGNLRPFRH